MKPSQQHLWMSLNELSNSPDFRERLADEFPQGASAWPEGLSRRRFLQLMGASLALAGLNGCVRLPDEKIVPYTQQPENLIPGRPLHYATTLRINGSPRGVVVTQHEGRPTHIAGNPRHPLSLGAADIWTTAAILELYDPDRLKAVMRQGSITSWDAFSQQVEALRNEFHANGGTGLYVLTPPICSPTEARLLRQLLATFPQAHWFTHDPLGSGDPSPLELRFNLAEADVIFALESDFLFDRPDSLALVRAFSQRRSSDDGRIWNRLYAAESCPTITGAKADHRFAVAPQDFDELATALLDHLRGASSASPRWPWLTALADDLHQHAGRSLLIGGRYLSSAAQAAFDQANALLGNTGQTLTSVPPVPEFSSSGTLWHFVDHIERGLVKALLLSGINPVYDAPADLRFAERLSKIPLTIAHSLCENETTIHCAWTLPAAHDLEAWGDACAIDGTGSIIQPLIAPLYGGRSLSEVVALLIFGLDSAGHDLVRETWQSPPSDERFDVQWRRWLRDGVLAPATDTGSASDTPSAAPPPLTPLAVPPGAFVLSLRPSPALWDGRYANNGWLQELPDPITKLTWDNVALISPATAAQWKLKDSDVISLTANGTKIEAPAIVVPGHADHCITLPLGYGRAVCGEVGRDVGFNAYLLRHSNSPWHCALEKLEVTGRTHVLAGTQEHFRMEQRDLLHVSRVDEAPPVPATTPPPPEEPPSLYPEFPYEGHKWALTIDLNTCVGCNACIIACQSENNIPVVGKEQVLIGREMQWIRVDRYYEGTGDNPRAHFQPVTCMQCENAPCEVVCPVAATQHDSEGLNMMVYNRCVGTRYCSNNCPYKVRRFNFLFYNADIPESRRLQLNPNVTVRSRGVMEKCTYCVQRIEEARIAARREHRPLRGDNIVTACQAACPAKAIVFGDLNDPDSIVSQNRRKPGHYLMLEELDTRPRTTYLEKRINPNPALEPRVDSI